MSLYSLAELYRGLPAGDFAIGAFNVHNMEYTQAVIQAAEQENAPVILMIGEPMIPFAGLEMLSNICLFAAKNSQVPVVVTLDHGKSLANILRCIELGISVMFDGSHLPFEENMRLTRELAEKAHQAGVSIEGELGSIGGSEDGEAVSAEQMTDPEAARVFARETGVDALAVAIGNCHGFYRQIPQLDLGRLAKIRELVDLPLVMHGGSDLPVDQSQTAISLGIKKFNVGTELKYTFADTLKRILSQDPMPFQPPVVLGPAREAVMQLVREKIRLFQSSGIAGQFHG